MENVPSTGESLPKSGLLGQAGLHSPLKVSLLVTHDFIDLAAYPYAS
jgi:hypothetical protein